ncbi:MAG: AraC family transcriptional regulator [Bacteroidota bacterium]
MNRNKIRNFSDIAFCVICVISSIVWDDVENVIWERVFLLGALLAPFSVWLFAKAIFNPSTITLKWKVLYVGLSLFIYLTIYTPPNPTFASIMNTGATLLYLFFAAMVIKEIYQYNNKSEKRYRSKITMILAMSCVFILAIVSDYFRGTSIWLATVVVERLSILAVSTYFIISNFILNEEIIPKTGISPTNDTTLVDRIMDKMTVEKLYLKEKLTIGELAEELDTPEYKVRQAINGDLGFKNFYDLVNSYRIKEASALLQNYSQAELSVLEIAYKTGFNSIAPFNRAFKVFMGTTPTEYRKIQIADRVELAMS